MHSSSFNQGCVISWVIKSRSWNIPLGDSKRGSCSQPLPSRKKQRTGIMALGIWPLGSPRGCPWKAQGAQHDMLSQVPPQAPAVTWKAIIIPSHSAPAGNIIWGSSSMSSHLVSVTTINISDLEHLVTKPKSLSKTSLLLDSKEPKGNCGAFQLGPGTCIQWVSNNVHLPFPGRGRQLSAWSDEGTLGKDSIFHSFKLSGTSCALTSPNLHLKQRVCNLFTGRADPVLVQVRN